MFWMYAGYAAGIYGVFGVLCLYDLATGAGTLRGAGPILWVLLLIVIAMGGEALAVVNRKERRAMSAALKSGLVSHTRVFVVGVVNACLAAVGVFLAWLPCVLINSNASLIGGIIATWIILSIAPVLGIAWLSVKAEAGESPGDSTRQTGPADGPGG